ncbi:MAG: potassium-dependent mechanosensitive channel [Tepidiphilus sp.]|nr:potassium-dependent mechanosensitive channel [Tepidiphilus sp.]
MRFVRRLCGLLIFCLVGALVPAFAAETSDDPIQSGLALIQDALQRNALPPDTSAALKQLLDRIQEAQSRRQQAEIRAALAEKLIEQTQRELQQLAASRPSEFADLRVSDSLAPSERAERLRRILEEERTRRQTQEALRAQLSDLEQPKERGDAAVAPPPPAPLPTLPSNDPLVQQALTLATLVTSQAQEAERRAALLESRLAASTRVLLSRRIERLDVELARLRQLREAVEKSTTAEVSQETSQVNAEAIDPRLARVEATNREWEARLQTLRHRLQSVRERQSQLQRETQERWEALESLKKRIAQQGLSPAVGNLLLEYRARLPSPSALRQELNQVRGMLEEVQLLELELRQAKRLIADPRERVRQILGQPGAADADGKLENALIEALTARSLTLETIDALRPALLAALSDLEAVLLRDLDVVEEFAAFTEQHLMWVASTRTLSRDPLPELIAVGTGALTLFQSFADFTSWRLAVTQSPPQAWLAVLLGFFLLLARARLTRLIGQHLAAGEQDPRHAGLLDTLLLLFLEAIQALPLPLIAYGCGTMILSSGEALADNFRAIGTALVRIAPFGWNVAFWQRVFAPGTGLAATRFHWPPSILKRLERTLRGFAWGVLPLGFLAVYLNEVQIDAPFTELGRTPFVVSMLLLSFFLWRIFRPQRGLLALAQQPTWLRLTAAIGGPGLPLVSALLAGAGYFYAAAALVGRFMSTLWVLLAFALLQHAARDFFLHRFDRQRESLEEGNTGEDARIDSSERQTLTLLNLALILGLAFVLFELWSSLLPATRILDEWVLWRYTETLGNETVTLQVTFADLLIAMIGFAVMWVAARNLPGLLELALQRTSRLDAGSKYALVTLLRYAIFTIGSVLILGELGMPWSKLQWLLAALSVGLGFGLQEIVANFVSGLIILFERPVRVGDLVTIGSDSGTVQRLTIRATVIEDFDRREILVPNKKLITEQVTNWTLSNSLSRIFVTIGVAYGTDPEHVEALLLEAVKATPGVLSDPAPSVVFARFGESSLDFEVRAIVADVNQRLSILGRLNHEIDRIFKANGIEIPFPQRDLHIRDIAWPAAAAVPAAQGAPQPPAA